MNIGVKQRENVVLKLKELSNLGVAEEGLNIQIPPFSYTLDTAQNTPMKNVTTEVTSSLERSEIINDFLSFFEETIVIKPF